MDAFAVILFPFVAGQNGFEAPLSDRQWVEFGAALRGIHTVVVPPSLGAQIPQETYAPHWRDLVRTLQARVEETAFTEPVAAEMAAFLRAKRDEISHIVARADALGDALHARSPEQVLCHADIHAANVLIGTDGALYIIDWDTLIFAPKERDLMFIGGGIGGAGTAHGKKRSSIRDTAEQTSIRWRWRTIATSGSSRISWSSASAC